MALKLKEEGCFILDLLFVTPHRLQNASLANLLYSSLNAAKIRISRMTTLLVVNAYSILTCYTTNTNTHSSAAICTASF